jgi:hypothetical protein
MVIKRNQLNFSRRHRLALFGLALWCGVGGWLSASAEGQLFGNRSNQAANHRVQRMGTINSPLIPESSGLAFSGYRDDLLWMINDSGNTNEMFGVTLTGELQARVRLEGAKNRDWESMARWQNEQQHFLIVAEVGDNLARYPAYSLFFLKEPQFEIDPNQDLPLELVVRPQRLDFVYTDGPRDGEAVGVDPTTGDIWMVEKIASLNPNRKPAGVYVIPFSQGIEPLWKRNMNGQASSPNLDRADPVTNHHDASPIDAQQPQTPLKVNRVADIPYRYVTGMDFSRDGNWMVVRTYLQAMLYRRMEDESWLDAFQLRPPRVINLPIQRQGETIAFSNDSQALIITSEKVSQPIWQIDIQQ